MYHTQFGPESTYYLRIHEPDSMNDMIKHDIAKYYFTFDPNIECSLASSFGSKRKKKLKLAYALTMNRKINETLTFVIKSEAVQKTEFHNSRQ